MQTRYLFLSLIFLSSAWANGEKILRYLPEARTYAGGVDTGYTQYATPSLYKSNQYVLSFDDGPHLVYTPQILDILKEYKVKATFFIVTKRLGPKGTQLAIRAIKEGHIVASHHHSHDHNNSVDSRTFKEKLKKSLRHIVKLYKLAGVKLNHLYYRFPYAEYGGRKDYHHMNIIREVSSELFGANCVRFVFWDHDTSDWVSSLNSQDIFKNLVSFQEGGKYWSYKIVRINGKKKIVKKLIANYPATQGGIILQHDVQHKTIAATRQYLEYAKRNYLDITPLNMTSEYREFSHQCIKAFNL